MCSTRSIHRRLRRWPHPITAEEPTDDPATRTPGRRHRRRGSSRLCPGTHEFRLRRSAARPRTRPTASRLPTARTSQPSAAARSARPTRAFSRSRRRSSTRSTSRRRRRPRSSTSSRRDRATSRRPRRRRPSSLPSRPRANRPAGNLTTKDIAAAVTGEATTDMADLPPLPPRKTDQPSASPAASAGRVSPKQKPDPRPMRIVYGAGAVAVVSVIAVGLVQPDFTATADQPAATDTTVAGRRQPGQRPHRPVRRWGQPGQRPGQARRPLHPSEAGSIGASRRDRHHAGPADAARRGGQQPGAESKADQRGHNPNPGTNNPPPPPPPQATPRPTPRPTIKTRQSGHP